MITVPSSLSTAEMCFRRIVVLFFFFININGHDFDEIEAAVEMAKNSQKPIAIIAHTVKGKGISFMENEIEWHGKAPNRKEMEQALRELGGH